MTEDRKPGRPSNDTRLKELEKKLDVLESNIDGNRVSITEDRKRWKKTEDRLVGYEGKISNIMEAIASLRRDVSQHDELRLKRGKVIHDLQEGVDKITKAFAKRFGGDLSPICPHCRKRVFSTTEVCPNCEREVGG